MLVKYKVETRFAVFLFLAAILCVTSYAAGPAPGQAPAGQTEDAGVFGVFMGGKRVATETFSVVKTADGSTITSDFKTEPGIDLAHQSSELALSQNGEIRHYNFHEIAPGKSQATLLPNNEFLMQKSTANPTDKVEEHPYLMPASSVVMDDYVFVQREILAWRYLASACRKGTTGALECPVKQKTPMGTVIPHERTSMLVNVEFLGREKTQIRDQERELFRLNFTSDMGEWHLWLDDQLKLVRISIPDQATEVIRD